MWGLGVLEERVLRYRADFWRLAWREARRVPVLRRLLLAMPETVRMRLLQDSRGSMNALRDALRAYRARTQTPKGRRELVRRLVKSGHNKAEVGRALGISRQRVEQLFRGRRN